MCEITEKGITIVDSSICLFGWETTYLDDYALQNLSIRISLPEPKVIENITEEELYEICEIVKQENYRVRAKFNIDLFGLNIEHRFSEHFNDYFEKLLEINLQHLLDCDDVEGVEECVL